MDTTHRSRVLCQEETERRTEINELLKTANISIMSDIQDLFKENQTSITQNVEEMIQFM